MEVDSEVETRGLGTRLGLLYCSVFGKYVPGDLVWLVGMIWMVNSQQIMIEKNLDKASFPPQHFGLNLCDGRYTVVLTR